MPDDKIKLPRSSYEELCKIIKAYGRLARPASLNEVSKLCVMNKTVVSSNNSFLASIELIEGGRAKLATSKGSALAKALEHEIPDQIQESWARVVAGNEFLEKMAVAVKIRGRMEISALEAHIAYSAGEAKSGQVMTGARAVVDILRAAGVVREHDGQLVATEQKSAPTDTTQPQPKPEPTISARAPMAQVVAPFAPAHSAGISLHIELRIDAKPSELEGLGKRVRELLKEMGDHEEADADAGAQDS